MTAIDIPALQVEDCAGLIELTQANGLEMPDCIRLHPMHIRFLAERIGLFDERSAKIIATLVRRLRALKPRIDHLADFLATCSDHRHADLDYETDYAAATQTICEEFCADLDDLGPNTSATGGVEHPQNRVTLPAAPAPASRQASKPVKSAAERAKDYRKRKQTETVTQPRDASRDAVTPRDATATPDDLLAHLGAAGAPFSEQGALQ